MKAIAGVIRAGRVIKYRFRDTTAESPEGIESTALRNADVDFVRRRGHLLLAGGESSGNCWSFAYAFDKRARELASEKL